VYNSVSGEIEEDFFTSEKYFTVKEMEVFKIANEMALPVNCEKCANGCLLQEIAETPADAFGGSHFARAAQAGGRAVGKAVTACGGCSRRMSLRHRRDRNGDFGGGCQAGRGQAAGRRRR
jgi:hypothetical protein